MINIYIFVIKIRFLIALCKDLVKSANGPLSNKQMEKLDKYLDSLVVTKIDTEPLREAENPLPVGDPFLDISKQPLVVCHIIYLFD